MGDNGFGNGELHGWKEIAAYLGKSVRAAQRWEHELGLPVRRIKTAAGQVIYARRDEIDAWRAAQEIPATAPDNTDIEAAPDPAPATTIRPYLYASAALMIGLVALIGVYVSSGEPTPVPPSYAFVGNALVAQRHGQQVWRKDFDRPIVTERPLGAGPTPFPTKRIHHADLDGDGSKEVLAVVTYSTDRVVVGDELYCFEEDGDLRWVYKPEMTLEFRSEAFRAPWYISAVSVHASGQRDDVYIAIVHNLWWAAAVVGIQPDGTGVTKFIHPGHLYALHAPDLGGKPHLLATGINNDYASASVAIWPADSPLTHAPGNDDSKYACVNCGGDVPSRYIIVEPGELTRANRLPYNRISHVFQADGTIHLHVEDDPEAPRSNGILTLLPDLTVSRFEAGDGYWLLHRAHESSGVIRHAAEQCPERTRRVRVFTAGQGWSNVTLRMDAPIPGSGAAR